MEIFLIPMIRNCRNIINYDIKIFFFPRQKQRSFLNLSFFFEKFKIFFCIFNAEDSLERSEKNKLSFKLKNLATLKPTIPDFHSQINNTHFFLDLILFNMASIRSLLVRFGVNTFFLYI